MPVLWGRRCFSVYARVACLLPFLGVFIPYGAKLSQLPFFLLYGAFIAFLWWGTLCVFFCRVAELQFDLS